MASGDLFLRNWRLQIDQQIFDGLRVSFNIVRDLDPDPNPAEVSIYNLSAESRSKVQTAGAAVILEAGYGDDIEQLYSGDVRRANHVKEGADWVTQITLGDGDTKYRTTRANLGFSKGTSILTVIKQIADATGLKLGNILSKAQDGDVAKALTEAVNGMVVSGPAFIELSRLMASLGYELSIQDGALQALAEKETTTEQVLLLSPESGLIGSPETGENGVVTAKSLLQPGTRPGRRIKLESRSIEGFFRVDKATHSGDTHGTDWYTEMELKPL